MIECIFTIDYEIYGNGMGSLHELIYDPTEKLRKMFLQWNAPFVAFVEAAELEIIEANGTDPAIKSVRRQIRECYEEGVEVALHLHPQWYNARFSNGEWILDYSEYNLCTLDRGRIKAIVRRSMDYLRDVVNSREFTPLSFRAGNWLFQPSKNAAEVLWEHGIRIDSSVFKGGLQRNHSLDYRSALKNGYFWNFQTDANIAEADGRLVEIPTYTVMVPFWKMLTAKRVGLQRKGYSTAASPRQKINRYLDLLRPWYPLKFDFCRMTFGELTGIFEDLIREDQASPEEVKPIVAIGHTKDLTDFATIERFLSFLREKGIRISRLDSILGKVRKAETERRPEKVMERAN